MIDEDITPECELAMIVHESEVEIPAVTSARIIAFSSKWGKERAIEAMAFLIMAKRALEMGLISEEIG